MPRLVELGGSDIFTHLLVVGPTRSGKTALILKPMIYQLLQAKANGVELGLSVVEPKGDVAQMVADMSKEMGIDYTHIDPMQPDITGRFNPMEGDIDDVAEATVVVLKGLFGKQEAFFATVQEQSTRSVTKLLKELEGDNLDITDVLNTLRDDGVLRQRVAELKARDGNTELVHFFENELLGSGQMGEKYKQLVIGLRAQLENIISNETLRHIMTGKSSINIDEHYAKGGVLAINTALGMLRTSGDAFGQFVIMHLQNGAFRRPGTEMTRIPHFLIVDEYSRYINPDVEIFLSLAAEYRVAGILATQSLGQLAIESGKMSGAEMKRAIMASCRNKIVFGGVTYEDALDFSNEFGEDEIIMRQSTYKHRVLLPQVFPAQFRDTETREPRFTPTFIRDGMPRFHYIHQLMQGGNLAEPALAEGVFVPRNWKELREWENPQDIVKQKGISILEKIKSIFKPSEKQEESNDIHVASDDEKEELLLEAEAEEAELVKAQKLTKSEQVMYETEREKLLKGEDGNEENENVILSNQEKELDVLTDEERPEIIVERENIERVREDPEIEQEVDEEKETEDEDKSKLVKLGKSDLDTLF